MAQQTRKKHQYKTLYMPVDALARHEDFDIWYEDGDRFLTVKSLNEESPWSSEKDQVALISRHDAEMGRIRPDPHAVNYIINVERFEYELQTVVIEEHYYFKGMLWHAFGPLSGTTFKFVSEDSDKSEVRVSRVKDFKGHGPCFEIKVREISYLRVAAAAVVAVAIKEEFKGRSQGEVGSKTSWLGKFKRNFLEHGIPYEEIKAGKKYIS